MTATIDAGTIIEFPGTSFSKMYGIQVYQPYGLMLVGQLWYAQIRRRAGRSLPQIRLTGRREKLHLVDICMQQLSIVCNGMVMEWTGQRWTEKGAVHEQK